MAANGANGVDGSVIIDINANADNFNRTVSSLQSTTIPDQNVNIGANTQGFQQGMATVEQEAQETSDKVKEMFQNALKFIGTAAVLNGLKNIVKEAVDSYSEYEQLVGGVDTLFKEHSELVQEYASQAYKEVGISANEYMETVTSFSASLLQSLDGDTKKAAESSNQALIDMADNANKMGTAIESIQNAYQGFAKQNYTMLDNLKLGYGGTKAEMERLIEDANKLREAQGEVANLSISNFSDIITAIHEVQEEMGITGTTAKEAAETIQGSTQMAEAAWQDLLTGLADPTQDLDKLIDNFIDAKTTQIENILPTVEHTVEGIGKAIDKLIPELEGAGEELAEMLTKDMIPALIDALKWIVQNKDLVATAIKGFVTMEVIKSIADYGNALGGVLTNLNSIVTGAPAVTSGLGSIATATTATGTAAAGATTAVEAFGLALSAWGVIIVGVIALALAGAEAFNQMARAAEEASKTAHGFSDVSNDALDRYSQITKASEEDAKQMANDWIEADQKALESAKERVRALHKMQDEMERSGNTSDPLYAQTIQEIEEAERNIQVLESLVFQEKKHFDELDETIDEGMSKIEATYGEHAAEAKKMRDASMAAITIQEGGEEGLKAFESQYDQIFNWEKEEYESYWAAKKAWLEHHKEDTEWWWKEYHKVEDYYQKQADAKEKERLKQEQEEQRKLEQEQRKQEQELRKQEQEIAKQEREHLNALKEAKEKAYRDIDIASRTSEQFANDLEQEKYVLDEQFKWLTEHQGELTEELYDKYYADWLKAHDSYLDKVEQQTEKDQKQLESIVTKLTNDAKSNIKNQISDVKNTFKDIQDAYNKGYDELIKKRDAYKKQLMGGSVFEVLQKTDEKTGEKYTQYTVNDLSKRLKTQKEFNKQLEELKKKRLEKGLAEELLAMDVDEGVVFAKQLNKMSTAEFEDLNKRYKELDEQSTRIANEYYADELKTLQNEFYGKMLIFYNGWNKDLKDLGAEGMKSYLSGFTFGWDNAEAEDLDVIFDPILRGLDEGSIDLSGVVARTLDNIDLGDKADMIVDTIVNAIKARQGDVKDALLELFDVDNIDWLIDSDMRSRAGVQSTGGYTVADNTAQKIANSNITVTTTPTTAAQNTAAKTTQSTANTSRTENITINANLKLTDGGKKVIAEIVNEQNKRIQIGVGK